MDRRRRRDLGNPGVLHQKCGDEYRNQDSADTEALERRRRKRYCERVDPWHRTVIVEEKEKQCEADECERETAEAIGTPVDAKGQPRNSDARNDEKKQRSHWHAI